MGICIWFHRKKFTFGLYILGYLRFRSYVFKSFIFGIWVFFKRFCFGLCCHLSCGTWLRGCWNAYLAHFTDKMTTCHQFCVQLNFMPINFVHGGNMFHLNLKTYKMFLKTFSFKMIDFSPLDDVSKIKTKSL